MVRISEKFLKQITLLAKEGATTVNNYLARIINVNDPIDDYDAVNKRYVDAHSGGGTVNNVSDTEDGSVNLYPTAARRILHSTGFQPGGSWDALSLADNTAAFSNYTFPLIKLDITDAVSGDAISFNGTSPVWSSGYLARDGSTTLTGTWDTGATYHIRSITPVNDTDVVIKSYVDDAIEGIAVGGMSVVSSSSLGAVNAFPSMITRALLSDGTTGGCVWRRWTTIDCTNVFTAGSISPNLINTTGSSSNQILRNVAGVAVWSNESSGVSTNEAKVVFHPVCEVAVITNINTTVPGSVFRGQTWGSGHYGTLRLFLSNQLFSNQNGPWVWNGPSSPLTRPTDWTGTLTLEYTHIFPINRAHDVQHEIPVTDSAPTPINRGGFYMTTLISGSLVVNSYSFPFLFVGPESNIIHYAEVSTTCNINIASPPAIIDGLSMYEGCRFWVGLHQSNPNQQGLWTWHASGCQRPVDWASGRELSILNIHLIYINNGALWGKSHIIACFISNTFIIDSGWTARTQIIGPIQWCYGGMLLKNTTLDSGNLSNPYLNEITNGIAKVSGVVKIDSTDIGTKANWTTVLTEDFETNPPIDGTGTTWTVSGGTLLRVSGLYHKTGTYAWYLDRTSTTIQYMYINRNVSNPGGGYGTYRARVWAKGYDGEVSAKLWWNTNAYSTTSPAFGVAHDTPANPLEGYLNYPYSANSVALFLGTNTGYPTTTYGVCFDSLQVDWKATPPSSFVRIDRVMYKYNQPQDLIVPDEPSNLDTYDLQTQCNSTIWGASYLVSCIWDGSNFVIGPFGVNRIINISLSYKPFDYSYASSISPATNLPWVYA
jgi:hypothetical protein